MGRFSGRGGMRPATFAAAPLLLVALLAGCGKQSTEAAPAGANTADGAAATAAGKPLPAVAATQSCDSLASTDLSEIGGAGSKITAAAEADQDGHRVCKVQATLAPAINLEVRLPLQGWTQRYMQIGCGGLCGSIAQQPGAADGCVPLQAGGFVIAATDMGHQGQSGEFGYDPQRRADFAYRAQHLTALAAKKLIAAFYGRSEAYAYFNGCSDGGREALIEAQRYPDDFDGIIAGAPAMIFQVQNSLHHGWLAVSNTGADGKPILLAGRLPLLHAAVLEACDALDGAKDGLIAEPRLCHFDPGTLQCAAGAGDTAKCLSAAEVEAVRKLYEGPHDPASGRRLLVGGPQYGSELNWTGVFVPADANQGIFSKIVALGALNGLIFDDGAKNVTLADLKFEAATYDKLRPRHPLFDATNPDLSAFAASGGKLILWHGWGDPHISPINTIAYHEAVAQQMGQERAQGFERLYLFPGMSHCGGGQGPSSIDLLSPMLDWVENGKAPGAVVARAASGSSDFGQPPDAKKTAAEKPEATAASATGAAGTPRLVCPYPSLAKTAAAGAGKLGTTQDCGPALYTGATPDWAGKDFFQPYAPRMQ